MADAKSTEKSETKTEKKTAAKPTVFVKDGKTRKAFTPADEVKFQYDGWTKK